MNLFVFLGPTMPVVEAQRLCPAEYLPPVTMGDVHALMKRQPTTIAIIDGTFQNAPAVWHKEILFALSRGVRVIGSSSMGALRAAELTSFGMEGVGAIYEAFRDGVYNDDDEVAVAHATREHGYRALSEAMVNIRAALAIACRRGLASAATADQLIALAKKAFYPHRSWPGLLQGARDAGLPAAEIAALEAFVRTEKPNQKREDAILLLRHLAAGLPRELDSGARFTFESSWFWKKLVESEELRRDAAQSCGPAAPTIDHAAVVRHVRLFAPERTELVRSALLLHLVEQRHGVTPSASAAVEETAAALRQEVDRLLPIELRRRGLFDAITAAVEAKWRRLEEHGLSDPGIEATGLDEEGLLAWLSQRCGLPAMPDATAFAAAVGFASAHELLREAAAEYMTWRWSDND
jgi:hypothetical protein